MEGAGWIWSCRTSITIENLGGQEIWLPMVDSLRLDWHESAGEELRNLYVEKGADTPSAQGTHLDVIGDGYRWTGKSSTYAHPMPGEAREIIPAEFVYRAGHAEDGWYAGIEFSGRTRIALERSGDRLKTVLGLNPDPGPFRTRIEPGGSFETPTVFLGAFAAGPDGAGNQLRPWVRAVLGNPLTWKDPHYPLTVNNSWGSGMAVDEALALRMIAQSKELGLEMFHVDAGWFRGVGDWYPESEEVSPWPGVYCRCCAQAGPAIRHLGGLDAGRPGYGAGRTECSRSQGARLAGRGCGPDWKPEEFKGQTIDLGVPAARDYSANEVKRIVDDYHLDMLEHDGYLVAQGCVRDGPSACATQPQHDEDESTIGVPISCWRRTRRT